MISRSRIVVDVAVFLSIFFLPWWLVAVAALVALFYFDDYYEIIFFGFVCDALYAVDRGGFWHLELIGLFATAACFIASIFLKKHMRFFNK